MWNTPDTSVQVGGAKLTMPTLDQTQQFEVENMLEQYGEVVCKKTRKSNRHLSHYSIWACLSLSGPAHTGQGSSMERSVAGRGSQSCRGGHSQTLPQPLVLPHGTSKETNGSVRLCIDFCHINKVTQPDPYICPRLMR